MSAEQNISCEDYFKTKEKENIVAEKRIDLLSFTYSFFLSFSCVYNYVSYHAMKIQFKTIFSVLSVHNQGRKLLIDNCEIIADDELLSQPVVYIIIDV